ncbi:MAG: type IV pilus biogenesis/stability protein PilW [Rhodanobacteraceae bacterium]
MRHKTCYVLAAMGLALGLAACNRTPGIIKYPTPMTNLKTAPHDTTQEDKQAAAQTHTQLAAAYMGQGHLKEAETALRKALSFDDKYIPAHTMLAILDWRINRMQDADKEFRTAVALDPSNGDTNNNYGKFLCEQGNREEAMKHFQRALADPFYKTPAVANANAGMCLMKFKDYAGAASYLHKALEIESAYGPALLAMAQLDLDQDKAFDARGYMQRFESSGQATPQSLLLGYQIATRLGDKDTATNYSNRLQDQFPNSTQAQSLNGPNHD